MKKQILDYLEQLNLDEVEAKLYLSLLESGPVSVRDLAESVEVKRTTAYFHIDILIEKGLVLKVVNGSKKQVAATDPEIGLKAVVEARLESAKEAQISLPEVITTLKTAIPEFKKVSDAEIQYYKGKNNIKRIYEEALASGELRSYVRLEEAESILTDNVDFFDNAFKKNENLRVREIFYSTPPSKKQTLIDSAKKNNYQYKFLPKELNFTSGDTLIYDGKVAIINYRGKTSIVVLHSQDYYSNSKELFDFIWNILPDENK